MDIGSVAQAKRESRVVEFKRSFDVSSKGAWCEIIKDVVAIANSGGGHVLIGVNDDGSLSGFDVASVLEFDPAKIEDQLSRYVPPNSMEVIVHGAQRDGTLIAVIEIGASATPVAVEKPGNYADAGDGGKPKCAFPKGMIYVRHGAKSEPATTADIRRFIDHILREHRRELMRGVSRVVVPKRGRAHSSKTSEVLLTDDPKATPVRLTDDASAIALRMAHPDETHPHRLKELLPILSERSGGRVTLTTNLFVDIRKLCRLDERREFVLKTRGGMQYSDALIEWFVQQVDSDREFLVRMKQAVFQQRRELGRANNTKAKRQYR